MYPIKVIVADDCTLFSESLVALLAKESSIRVCAAAADGARLLQQVERHHPDVVLVDLYIPLLGATDAVRVIKRLYPATAALGMTFFDDATRIEEWRAAGAEGYVFKASVNGRELVEALHSVHSGRHWFPVGGNQLSRQAPPSSSLPMEEIFNEKELEIIRLICQEYSSKQIADLTGLTHRTVESYRKKIMLKIGAQNRMGIALYAVKHGIFKV